MESIYSGKKNFPQFWTRFPADIATQSARIPPRFTEEPNETTYRNQSGIRAPAGEAAFPVPTAGWNAQSRSFHKVIAVQTRCFLASSAVEAVGTPAVPIIPATKLASNEIPQEQLAAPCTLPARSSCCGSSGKTPPELVSQLRCCAVLWQRPQHAITLSLELHLLPVSFASHGHSYQPRRSSTAAGRSVSVERRKLEEQ